jgi:hypothetical protein
MIGLDLSESQAGGKILPPEIMETAPFIWEPSREFIERTNAYRFMGTWRVQGPVRAKLALRRGRARRFAGGTISNGKRRSPFQSFKIVEQALSSQASFGTRPSTVP